MPEDSNHTPLLSVKDLRISFRGDGRNVDAVKGISFNLSKGRTLAIVGESGSGKSVSAMSMTKLLPPPPVCQVTGEILLDGKNTLEMKNQQLRKIRGGEIAYIFQEPSSSLNPVYTVGHQIAEAVQLHRPEVNDVQATVIDALKQVGIRDADKRFRAYPHEMSGGMQQRVMIAMALACRPRILVADEPTTALDVTIQKQIMELLATLKKDTSMSILLITHNFGIVKDFAEEVIVMFSGEIVEQGATKDILANPKHPYTQALIGCIPKLGARRKRLTTIDYNAITDHA